MTTREKLARELYRYTSLLVEREWRGTWENSNRPDRMRAYREADRIIKLLKGGK
jgi:hypothetical protein